MSDTRGSKCSGNEFHEIDLFVKFMNFDFNETNLKLVQIYFHKRSGNSRAQNLNPHDIFAMLDKKKPQMTDCIFKQKTVSLMRLLSTLMTIATAHKIATSDWYMQLRRNFEDCAQRKDPEEFWSLKCIENQFHELDFLFTQF